MNATASLLDLNTALPLAPAKGRGSRMELGSRYVRIDMGRAEDQKMTEYALIAVGVIAVLIVLGPKIADAFTSVSNSL